MFNLIKIAEELLVSNWDYFLGAFEKIDKNQLNNLMFNNNTQKLLNNIGFNLSNDDFIYLCCLYNTNFQESVKEQIESGFLNKEYISNIKPNEFVLKYFQLLKKIILSKDFNFINKYIKELGFVYNIINFAIYKIKFNNNKLTQEDFDKLSKNLKINLVIYKLIKDEQKNSSTRINRLNDVLSKTNTLVKKINNLEFKTKSMIDSLSKIQNKSPTEEKIYMILQRLIPYTANNRSINFNINNFSMLDYEYDFSYININDYKYNNQLKDIESAYKDIKNFIKNEEHSSEYFANTLEYTLPWKIIENFNYALYDILDNSNYNTNVKEYIKKSLEDKNNISLEDILYYILDNNEHILNSTIGKLLNYGN